MSKMSEHAFDLEYGDSPFDEREMIDPPESYDPKYDKETPPTKEIPVDGEVEWKNRGKSHWISLQRKEARRKIGEEERYQEAWEKMNEKNRHTREHNLGLLGLDFATCNAVKFKHCPKRSYFEFTFDDWKKRIAFQKMEGLVGHDLTNQLCFMVQKVPLETRRWFYDNVLPDALKEGNGGPIDRP